jgi:hypothetical protein
MEIGKIILILISFIVASGISYLIYGFGGLLSYLGIFIFLTALLILSAIGLESHTLVIIFLIIIGFVFSWMIGGFLYPFIGDWAILVGVIIFLAIIWAIATSQGWSTDLI